jgi:predicted DNA-binding transcriptional regulator AlpA
MLRNTDREFRRINRTRGLTRRDKQQLENFYVDRIFTPEAARILRGSANGPAALLRLLNAKDLESWLKIDRKTIYSYVVRKLIPHIRIESNVRFVEPEIRSWLERHKVRPRTRKRSKPAW